MGFPLLQKINFNFNVKSNILKNFIIKEIYSNISLYFHNFIQDKRY